jgi:hypothetical protein
VQAGKAGTQEEAPQPTISWTLYAVDWEAECKGMISNYTISNQMTGLPRPIFRSKLYVPANVEWRKVI